MRKKLFSFTLGAMLYARCLPAEAQQPGKVYRIGWLRSDSPPPDYRVKAFRQRLRELGYVEGNNIIIHYRYAKGKRERLPELAAELVRSKVDVIVASGDPAVRAAKNVTKTVPIVILGLGGDPVEVGLVASLAHPGGNVTGLTSLDVEISSKRLDLFKEAVPQAARILVLYNPSVRGNILQLKEVQAAAPSLGLTVQTREVRDTQSLDAVLAAWSKERPHGIYVPGGPPMTANRKRIAEYAIKSRLPAVSQFGQFVEAGGLMSYGPDRVDQYRRGADYVDRILQGAKPADLPVERPTKFVLEINLKTAKQIGVTIPPEVLYRADRVIR